MDFKEKPIKVGRISKVHGINGGMVVETGASMLETDQWPEWAFVYIDTGLVPYRMRIDKCFWKDDHHFVIFLDKVDRPENCTELINQDLHFSADTMEPEQSSEYGFSGLTGYEVRIKGQEGVGVVMDYLDISGNPLLVIDWEGQELMVPARDEFIMDFNPEKKVIKFDLPEGLIDLN